ncbi:MAG TPA: hypothetical protein VF877_04855 [Gaiellaceae bacterium]
MGARRSLLVASCVSVLVLAAAGCGGGGGTKYSGASPETWAATVCGALTNWAQGLQANSRKLGSGLRKASITTVKARFVVFMKNAGTSADTMIDRVHRVGPPAVKNGEAIQRELETGLRSARASFERAEKRAKELPTSNAQSFASGVTALGRDIRKELRATGEAFYNLGDKYDNEQLNNATSDEPACNTVSS